jgi:hypothetical protein
MAAHDVHAQLRAHALLCAALMQSLPQASGSVPLLLRHVTLSRERGYIQYDHANNSDKLHPRKALICHVVGVLLDPCQSSVSETWR